METALTGGSMARTLRHGTALRRHRDIVAASLATAALIGWVGVTAVLVPLSDVTGYLAAGERLNAGHALYALGPGDRHVFTLPPFFSAPFLYPPSFAVIWRPLAALPGELGLWLWIAALFAVMGGWLAWQLVQGRVGTAIAILVLSLPIALTATTGNVNGFFMVGLAALWGLRGRDPVSQVASGLLLGTMVAWKVFPGVLLLWFLVTGRWRAAAWTLAVALAWTLLGLVVVGPSATVEYLTQVVPATRAMGISAANLTGLPALTFLLLGVGLAAVVLLRRRPAISHAAAVVTGVLAWPSLGIASLAMLASPIRALREGGSETEVGAVRVSDTMVKILPSD